MIERRGASPLRAVLPLLLAVALTAACSSSKSDTVGPNASGQQSVTASTPAAASTPAGGTSADPATAAAIKKAYATFFSSTTTPAQSQTALQHGEAFKKTLEEQAKQSYSQNTTAQVQSIAVSGKVADVKFSLMQGKKVLLPDIQGKAVQEGGTWKVAAATFCALLKLQGSQPPACSDTSITALPQ